jgi:FAD/FMN-containing dehydrogenase
MDDRALTTLARQIEGGILRPDDDGYDLTRAVWNDRFNPRPDAIASCTGPADVQAAVAAATETGTPITVKGNGHSYAGESARTGGLLIDLKPMAEVMVDPESRTARVGPGATWGQFDAAAQAHGLATTGGTVSTVGVSGVSLGGGEGWLGRAHGMTIDNLIAADLVTASGELARASETDNPDLFWALRGGGGNFGIVTSFEFALHEVGPELLAGQVMYPGDEATRVLRAYRDYFATASEQATGFAFFLRIPPIPAFPAELHGALVLDLVLCYVGPIVDGEAALAPLRNLGPVIADTVGPVPYLGLQQAFDAGVAPGNRWYTRGQYLNGLTDGAIDTLVGGLEPFPGEFTLVYLGPGGGATSRVAPDATAFPHRDAPFGMHIWPGWVDPSSDDAIMGWARQLHEAMTPYGTGGVYVNLLGEDEAARVPAAYGSNYERLRDIKRIWDPMNIFRANHNIPPAG